jgi:hypothetical protein
MADRWVPTLGFDLAKVGGAVHVLKRGGLFVKSQVSDDEVMLRPVAVATDYDEGVRILRALRSTVTSEEAAGA